MPEVRMDVTARDRLRWALDSLWGYAKAGKTSRYDADSRQSYDYYLMSIENVDGFSSGVLRELDYRGWVPLSEVLEALRGLDPVEAALAGQHAFTDAADFLAEWFGAGPNQGDRR